MKSVKKEIRKVAIRPSSVTTIYFNFLDLHAITSYFGKNLKTMYKIIIIFAFQFAVGGLLFPPVADICARVSHAEWVKL